MLEPKWAPLPLFPRRSWKVSRHYEFECKLVGNKIIQQIRDYSHWILLQCGLHAQHAQYCTVLHSTRTLVFTQWWKTRTLNFIQIGDLHYFRHKCKYEFASNSTNNSKAFATVLCMKIKTASLAVNEGNIFFHGMSTERNERMSSLSLPTPLCTTQCSGRERWFGDTLIFNPFTAYNYITIYYLNRLSFVRPSVGPDELNTEDIQSSSVR
jgi:hypothetical protein